MHGLKYSLKLKELNKKNVHTNMKCYHPSSLFPLSLAYAHLPRHGKKCWAKKRRICFVHLRIFNLWWHPGHGFVCDRPQLRTKYPWYILYPWFSARQFQPCMTSVLQMVFGQAEACRIQFSHSNISGESLRGKMFFEQASLEQASRGCRRSLGCFSVESRCIAKLGGKRLVVHCE